MTSKALALLVVLTGLLLALTQVSSIVHEREGRLREAESGVAASLATQQELIGPVLQRRCEETWSVVSGDGKDRKTVTERRQVDLVATPKSLSIDAAAQLDPRRRGLYKVNGYVLNATLQAQWASLAALQPQAEHAPSTLRCDDPVLFVAIHDVRGLRSVAVQAQGKALDVTPGTPRRKLASGFKATLPPALWPQGEQPLAVQMRIEMVGTRLVSFAPVAEHSDVRLKSDWPHPSFQGRFLPIEREIGASGFDARWRITALATAAPRQMKDDTDQVESFWVEFVDPVNRYLLADRATKYGLLFIVLTFVGVALTEVLRRARVHPVQYALVGSALAIFFLLLVSLSEHMAFGLAYAVAAIACASLLAFYGVYVLGGLRPGAGLGAGIAALYVLLYVLLQQEQRALVLGSVMLFVALAAVMVLTRRLDWYALVEQLRQGGGINERRPPGHAAAMPAADRPTTNPARG